MRLMPILRASLATAVVGALCVAVGGIGAAVVTSPSVQRLDLLTVVALHHDPAPALIAASDGLATLGGTAVVTLLTLVAAIALVAARRLAAAAWIVGSVAVTQVLVTLLKDGFSRPRPSEADAFAHAAGFSFPSGHAATAVALFGTAGVLALALPRRGLAIAGAVAACALVVAIGASRVYLGVHYPTDVLAGWLVGGAVVVATHACVTRLPRVAARA